jgi:hypothetical protein
MCVVPYMGRHGRVLNKMHLLTEAAKGFSEEHIFYIGLPGSERRIIQLPRPLPGPVVSHRLLAAIVALRPEQSGLAIDDCARQEFMIPKSEKIG